MNYEDQLLDRRMNEAERRQNRPRIRVIVITCLLMGVVVAALVVELLRLS